MKRAFFILAVCLLLVLAVSFSIKPAIIFLAQQQFKKVFIGSAVSIGNCSLKPLEELTLTDIEIKKGKIYNFQINTIKFQYNPLAVIKGEIQKFCLKNAKIILNLPESSILESAQYFNLKSKRRFSLAALELAELELNVKTKELNLNTKISGRINLRNKLIENFDCRTGSLEGWGWQLDNAVFQADQATGGLLFIDKIKYNKLKVEKISSQVRLKDNFLSLDSLSAGFLGGKIQAEASFKIDESVPYALNLKLIEIDLSRLVEDFNLQEKVNLRGRLTGAVSLEGIASRVTRLGGDLSAVGTGGTLTIKDTEFLEKVARNSRQPLEVLVESFKNYQYNRGVVKLFLENDNLILDIALEGEAGKRNLTVTLHNFKLGGWQ